MVPTKITPVASKPRDRLSTLTLLPQIALVLVAVISTATAQASTDKLSNDELSTDKLLQEFYAQRDFRPVWSDPARQLEVAQLARLAELHGLNGDDYQLSRVVAVADEYSAAADVRVTQTVLLLATHLRYGKVDPTGTTPRARHSYDHDERLRLLEDASKAESLLTYLDNLAPHTLLYRRLQHSLARYRTMQSAGARWPWIKSGPTLTPGMRDAHLPVLRQRLGLQPAPADDASLYDAELVAAVEAFQTSHRLESDGVLGPQTRRALNVSLDQRIDQLRVNLEWQRWSSTAEASDYLRVNIPHYTLQWIEGGARSWSMRTQVGNSDRQTPVFRSAVNAISANPEWTVPPTIFREDILPHLRDDPSYLQEKRMYVVDRRGRYVDASDINWRAISADEFPYRLRRKPGDGNALGRMKFLIPNPYLIYLHDTPAKHLFNEQRRATSSGCIRVEDPDRLADFLVSLQKQRSRSRLAAARNTDKPRFIGLDAPVPIIVLYATVDLNDNGELVFAEDIYQRDPEVLAILDSTPQRRADILVAALTPD